VPPIRLHDLRHFAAPLALAAGVDTYTTVLPDVARAAAEATAALLPVRWIRHASPQPGKTGSTKRRPGVKPQVRAGAPSGT
jgi:hypothetical protein